MTASNADNGVLFSHTRNYLYDFRKGVIKVIVGQVPIPIWSEVGKMPTTNNEKMWLTLFSILCLFIIA